VVRWWYERYDVGMRGTMLMRVIRYDGDTMVV
jgi:hypothetical protein